MNRDLGIFFLLVVLGWMALLVHLVTLVSALHCRSLALWKRTLAILPPVTPVIAWLAGRRVAPILWVVSIGAYLVARTFIG